MSIFTEMKQRFIKFDTLHGLYLLPLSIIGLYVAIFHLEYVLHALAAIIFSYGLVESIRLIFYNPVKKEALKVVRRDHYIKTHTMKVAPGITLVAGQPVKSVNDAAVAS